MAKGMKEMRGIKTCQMRVSRCAAFVLLAIALTCGCALAQVEYGGQDLPVWDMSADPAEIPEELAVLQSEEMFVPDIANEPETGENADVQRERVYIRVNGAKFYSSRPMNTKTLKGTVTGIALALRYPTNEEISRSTAIRVVFVTGDGVLHEGVFAARDILAMEYAKALAEIGEDALRWYTDDVAWPLSVSFFAQIDSARPSQSTSRPKATYTPISEPEFVWEPAPVSEPEFVWETEATPEPEFVLEPETTFEPEEEAPAPYVVISQHVAGELIAGTRVELKAEVFHLPIERIIGYRWKNNSDGAFREVPGVTGDTCVFLADEHNTGCEWIVEVLLREAQSEEDVWQSKSV